MIFYSEIEKERNKTIKEINNINQIIKHTFESFVLNHDGVAYQSQAKVSFGYHMARTNLQKYLCVPEDGMVKFSCPAIFKAIKDRKKEIRGYGITDNIAHFITDTGDRIIIGQVLDRKTSDEISTRALSFMEIYNHCDISTELNEDDIDSLVNKVVLNKEYDEYKMVLTHKILPQIKKVNKAPIMINDEHTENHTFVGIFTINHGDVVTTHFYKFLKF